MWTNFKVYYNFYVSAFCILIGVWMMLTSTSLLSTGLGGINVALGALNFIAGLKLCALRKECEEVEKSLLDILAEVEVKESLIVRPATYIPVLTNVVPKVVPNEDLLFPPDEDLLFPPN